MRIVGGKLKGRRFYPPKKLPVRPTTDFAKEGLFNILENNRELDGLKVLDLCAGTGNISYEFASRNAKSITCVDQNIHCIKYIQKQVFDFDINSISTVKSDMVSFIKKTEDRYDIIFADPPYNQLNDLEKLLDLVVAKNLLEKDGMLILEHSFRVNMQDKAFILFTRRYGNVNFTCFKPH